MTVSKTSASKTDSTPSSKEATGTATNGTTNSCDCSDCPSWDDLAEALAETRSVYPFHATIMVARKPFERTGDAVIVASINGKYVAVGTGGGVIMVPPEDIVEVF